MKILLSLNIKKGSKDGFDDARRSNETIRQGGNSNLQCFPLLAVFPEMHKPFALSLSERKKNKKTGNDFNTFYLFL